MTTPRLSTLQQNGLQQLRMAIQGRVIAPGDDGYDQGRLVIYGDPGRRPAVIVRAAGAEDVQRVVEFARQHALELAVRSGGHSSAGHGTSNGGIVLDLGDMRALQIDPDQCTAWAETGLTAGEYTIAAGTHGLATGFGDTGSVGIGGITLGGGIGYLVRKHGLTIDSLLAAEIVTADGQLLQVDAGHHPDLFWAIRGGGGNFGVATRFQFKLHDVGQALGGMLILPATPDTIAGFMAEAESAPENLSTIANIMKAPPMPFLPAEVHGKLILMGMMLYAGDPAQGEAAMKPFRSLAAPLADMVRPIRYPEMFPQEGGGAGGPVSFSSRTMFMDYVDRKLAQEMIERIQASSAMMAAVQLRALGGAMARVPVEETAFAHRDSRIMANIAAMYAQPEQKAVHETWVQELAGLLRQEDTGAYVNFMGDEGRERVQAAYPGPTWERLRTIKQQYDPANLFRLNQNIPPA